MSYDVSLIVKDALGEDFGIWEGNYTSNVAPMWQEALGYRLADIHQHKGGDVIDDLTLAVRRMREDPETYKAMNPPNGWGDYDGALRYLETILDRCRRWPDARIEVSY